MPVQFSCPECQAVLRSSKPIAAGKMIRCPKCEVFFSPQTDELEPADEEEDVRGSRRARPEDDEDDRDYDEEEERPRRKKRKPLKKKKASGSSPLMLGIIGGAVLLVLLAAGGVLGFVDIPGLEWSAFLRTFGNKGTGDEELLAYAPADTDFVIGVDTEALQKISPKLDPTRIGGTGPGGTEIKEAIGIDEHDLVGRIVVTGKVPQQTMGGPMRGMGVDPGQFIGVAVIRTRAPIDQKLLYRYFKKKNIAPNYAKANGKIYYKSDAATGFATNSYVFAASNRTLVLMPATLPPEKVEQVVASDGKTVPLTGSAWSILPEASGTALWGALAIQGELQNQLRSSSKGAANVPANFKPLVDALTKAQSCGFWLREHNERIILGLGVSCADAKAASTVKTVLEQAYNDNVKSFTGQIGLNAAIVTYFKAAPTAGNLLRDVLNKLKFRASGTTATASASTSKTTLAKAIDEVSGLRGAMLGGAGGMRPGGMGGRRLPGAPGMGGLPRGGRFPGGPMRGRGFPGPRGPS